MILPLQHLAMPMQLKEQAPETVSSVTLVKEQPVKEMLMLHLISQQLWKLPLFSSGKKASYSLKVLLTFFGVV